MEEYITYSLKTFAFEGLDGTGKETMSKMLKDYLIKEKHIKTERVSFPRYDNPASYCLRKWLKGKYDRDNVGWRNVCAMYYTDMMDWVNSDLFKLFDDKTSIIMDRWIFSNMICQCIDGEDYKYQGYVEEARERIDEIYDMANFTFGLFWPSELIITDLPLEISMKNLEKKTNKDKNETLANQERFFHGYECFLDWIYYHNHTIAHIIDMSDGNGNMDTAENNFKKVIKSLELD